MARGSRHAQDPQRDPGYPHTLRRGARVQVHAGMPRLCKLEDVREQRHRIHHDIDYVDVFQDADADCNMQDAGLVGMSGRDDNDHRGYYDVDDNAHYYHDNVYGKAVSLILKHHLEKLRVLTKALEYLQDPRMVWLQGSKDNHVCEYADCHPAANLHKYHLNNADHDLDNVRNARALLGMQRQGHRKQLTPHNVGTLANVANDDDDDDDNYGRIDT